MIDYHFKFDNKIFKQVNIDVHFNRQHKIEGQSVSNYKLHASYDSKIFNPQGTYFHLMWTLNGENKAIKSDLYLEDRHQKLVSARLDLDPRDDAQYDKDYDLKLNANSVLGHELDLSGHFAYGLLASNIDLKGNVEMNEIKIPLGLKIAHRYNSMSESFVLFNVDFPILAISNGGKITFQFDSLRKLVSIDINSPESKANDAPKRIYFDLKKQENSKEKNFQFGFKNFNLDMSQRTSVLAEFIKKTNPDDQTLNQMSIEYSLEKDADKSSTDVTLEIEINDNTVTSLHAFYSGNLQAIRANPDEIVNQQLAAGFNLKAFEYAAGLKTNILISNSKSKKFRSLNANILVDGLLKSFIKLNEIDFNSENKNGKVNVKALINREAHVYKTVEIIANGQQIRGDSSSSEFDFDFTKTLNDGTKKSSKGVAKYSSLSDLKNFEASINIPNIFNSKASIVFNQQQHQAKINLVYLDQPIQVEKNFEFEFKKNIDKLESIELKIEAKNGKPGSLNNDDDQLNYLVLINGKLSKIQLPNGDKKVVAYQQSLKYKSPSRFFDIDSSSSYKLELPSKVIKISSKSNTKFPAYKSNDGIRFLNRELAIQIDLEKKSAKIDYSFDTDSKILGFLFTNAKISYKHERSLPKLIDASFNASYKLASSSEKEKQLKLNLNVDACGEKCFGVNLGVEQEIRNKCPKALLNFKYSRSGVGKNMNIASNVNLKCDQLLITDTKLQYVRESNASNVSIVKRNVKLSSESMLYEAKKFDFAFSPFNKLNGYAKIAFEWNANKSFQKSFEYSREIDESTNKMKAATYKLSIDIASKYKKSCELNLEKKVNYLNKLNCALNVPSVPKQLNYGYKLFVAKPAELFFGSRNFEFSLQFPTGRVIQIDYKGNKATPIDNTDDDEDLNDDREFNGTANIYLDFINDRKKVVVINLKRDNIAPGHFKFFIEALDTPLVKVVRLELNDKRLFNETNVNLGISYELKNGKKNRFDLFGKMSSDLVDSSFSIEANLARPKFNIQYSNEFNKLTGRLSQLSLRVAELLNFVVDKEYDPNNRRISLELYNRADSGYQVEAKSNFENDVYTVQGILKKGGKSVSSIKSVYDSINTNLNVQVDAFVTKKNYQLNFGLLNESFAIGNLKQDGKFVGIASVELAPVKLSESLVLHDLVLNLKWNRFWHNFQENLLGGIDSPSASQGDAFNSYFGDVYAELTSDLKPILDSIKQERSLIKLDLVRLAGLQLEFYGSVIPAAEQKRQEMMQSLMANKMAPVEPEVPLYKRIFQRYNSLADRVNICHEQVYQSKFRILSRLIPRLSRISYNAENNKSQFENNFQIRKRISRASNLYQFNAEYRDRVRRFGSAILKFKSLLVRDIKGISLRALINKYKYRSIRYDYTAVGSVFNKRNIIGFGGESESLHTKSRYLLAHDTSKNRFSVILNYEDNQANTLSVYFYGKGPIGISHDKATVNNKVVALPQEISLENGKSIYIGKIHNGICVHVDHEVKVCCYEDSNSCTIALTRWWYGKVNGLFGKTNNFPQKLKQEDWAVDKVDFRKAQLKPSADDAIKKCYYLFGKHRRSPFKSAFMVYIFIIFILT